MTVLETFLLIVIAMTSIAGAIVAAYFFGKRPSAKTPAQVHPTPESDPEPLPAPDPLTVLAKSLDEALAAIQGHNKAFAQLDSWKIDGRLEQLERVMAKVIGEVGQQRKDLIALASRDVPVEPVQTVAERFAAARPARRIPRPSPAPPPLEPVDNAPELPDVEPGQPFREIPKARYVDTPDDNSGDEYPVRNPVGTEWDRPATAVPKRSRKK